MHISIFVGITAVKYLLSSVVLHPDGDFQVAHLLNMRSRHVLREFQVLQFASDKVNSCAFCIGQHLHENVVE